MAQRRAAENPLCPAAAEVFSDYRFYALLASHLANFGYGNTGWVGDYKGIPMLFAQRDSCALALGSLGALAQALGRIRRALPMAGKTFPAISR